MLNKDLLLMSGAKQEVSIQADVEWYYTWLGVQQIAVRKNGEYLGEWGVHEAPIPTIQAYVGDTLEFSMVNNGFTLTLVEATAGLELLIQGSRNVEIKVKDSAEPQRLQLRVSYA